MGEDQNRRPVVRTFVLCAGLGRIHRGYETFSQECFDVLVTAGELDVYLFKGGGTSRGREICLSNLPRTGRLANVLSRVIGKSEYFIEQATFTFSLFPYLLLLRPHVIYYSDGNVGNLLWRWRRLTRARFKLLLSNGAPYFPPTLPRCDFIQQVVPSHLESAKEDVPPNAQQGLLPYGIKLPPRLEILSPEQQMACRRHLGLPEEGYLVLSVGAINMGHKRMDYLVRELAQLAEPRPFLLMLGQQEAESPEIVRLASELLGTGTFSVKTVPAGAVADYYRVADLFVLCSLCEGLPRVLLEAMGAGLPCLTHDYEVARFVLGDEGFFADFTDPGNLMRLLEDVLSKRNDPAAAQRRFASIRARFGWDSLLQKYVSMITRCARGALPPV